MADPSGKPEERDWRPVPDPSLLTTEALRREIGALAEKFSLELAGMRGTLEARLQGMDRAQDLAEAHLNRVPSDTDKQITQLEKLHDERFRSFELRIEELSVLQVEKFRGIDKQFDERDTRVAQTAHDTKVAVDAALLAQQAASDKQAEAFAASIQKSETAFFKQIDSMGLLITSSKEAADDKFEDLKERLTRIEGAAVGQLAQKSETHTTSGMSATVILTIVAVISLIVTAFVAFRH